MHIAVVSTCTLPALSFIGQAKVRAERPRRTRLPVEASPLWTVKPSGTKLRSFSVCAEVASWADVTKIILRGVGVGSSIAGYGYACTDRAVVSDGADVAGGAIHWRWRGGVATAVVASSAVGVGLSETLSLIHI